MNTVFLQLKKSLTHENKFQRKGFTLAEVLITLGIIGVVAAMTLPSVIGNYQKVQTVSQLKKVYTTLNQAFKRSEADNESSVYWKTGGTTQEYFNTYWKPYLNVLRYCSGGMGEKDCNYKSSTPWKRANGLQDALLVVYDAQRVPFILSDGTFVSILTHSGYGSAEGSVTDGVVNGNTGGADRRILIDLNASGNPNQFGKDVFLFERVPGKGIMAYGYQEDKNTINENCSKDGSGFMCAAKLMQDGWQIKDNYPW